MGHAAARGGGGGATGGLPARPEGQPGSLGTGSLKQGQITRRQKGLGLPLPLRLPMGLGLVLRWDWEAAGSGPLTPEAAACEL